MFIYYLLYEIKASPLLWIVTIDNNNFDLLEILKDFNSNFENYYIIEREIENSDIYFNLIDNLKQFQIFKKKNTDRIIFVSN